MSAPQVPFNFNPIGGSLTDALNLLKKDVMMNMNVHHVGTIESFDASDQTASVTINYPKTYFKLNPATGLYQAVLVNYPVALDCPVICLGGGATALTFPIEEGDECLVLFNDRDFGNWFNGATGAAVATPRLHSFSDAIVIVGLRSLANSLDDYDTVRAVLSNGSTMVGVGPNQVKIANATTTLNTLLQNLVSAIKALTTLNSDSTTGAVSTVSQTALTAIGTQIAGLLE